MSHTIVALGLLALLPEAAWAVVASDSGSGISWGAMGVNLFGGLALFLFGMEQMGDALKAVAGDRMRVVLEKLTANRLMGAFTGALVTAVIQSSSITTVLVVGFITAGLMTAAQSVGVIMGANIGTTITGQIIAFKVTKAAFFMIALGFGLYFIPERERLKQYGLIIMGLGMVFLGMSVMSDAMQPLRTYQPFLDMMVRMENPLIGIVVAAVFTGLIQSSSAATGIVIVMASQGFVSLPAGIALVFGANIGTCVTALLAAIGKPREALRAAMTHVLFNVAGVLLWVAFIPYLAEAVVWLSPVHPELEGLSRLSAETPRQIANAHTLFNVANTFIFIGFTSQIAWLVERLVPVSALEKEGMMVRAKYLDEELLSTPSLALDRVRLEVLHMGERVQDMLERIMPAILEGNGVSLTRIRKMDDQVDILYEQIIDYLGKISTRSLTIEQTEKLLKLMDAVSELENIGDTIETNMVDLGLDRIKVGLSISKPTAKVLRDFQGLVQKACKLAVKAVAENSLEAAQEVVAMKQAVAAAASSAALHEAQRLVARDPHRIPAYTIEIDIVEKQKRIYYYAKRMAKAVIASAGQVTELD